MLKQEGTMKKLILCLFSLCFLTVLASAKPMPAPSLEQGVLQSESIVVAKFHSAAFWGGDYLGGVPSIYKVTKVLKGNTPLGSLKMNHAFHDGSACLPAKGVILSEQLPSKDSSWILILGETEGVARTYRGDFGRMPDTPANRAKITKLLKK